MPSVYLQSTDYVNYGVPNATAAQVTAASLLIDAYLKRPEGLIYAPDAQGQPCYMTSLNATASFTLNNAIAPGQNVAATLTGPVSSLQPGDVLILDRANTNTVEACVVAAMAVAGNGVTLANVSNNHAAAATVEAGLIIEEQKYMPQSRPITFCTRSPLMRIISGVGRYGYGRRGDASNYNLEQFNLLAAVSKFGGPPAWEVFNPLSNGYDRDSGQVWIPAGIMLAYYSEVKLRYVAGFTASTLPGVIKRACAALVNTALNTPKMGNVKRYKAGDSEVENFSASLLDEDTKEALNIYRARVFG